MGNKKYVILIIKYKILIFITKSIISIYVTNFNFSWNKWIEGFTKNNHNIIRKKQLLFKILNKKNVKIEKIKKF